MIPFHDDIQSQLPSPETLAIQNDVTEKLSPTAKKILFCILNPPEKLHRYMFTSDGGIRTSKFEHQVVLNFIRKKILGNYSIEKNRIFIKAVKEIKNYVDAFPN